MLYSQNEAQAASALDHIELELIKYPDGVRGFEMMDNFTINLTLYNQFNSPEFLLSAVNLLSRISSGDVTTSVDVSTIPSTLALTDNAPGLYPAMLAASRQASKYLQDLERNLQAMRMKTIMSYIVLHLTLEHAVVPRLQEEEPDRNNRSIQGIKYLRFAEILNETCSEDSRVAEGTTLRTHSQYGKTFWEYGQALGIASLLLFAVSDVGLTKIGRVTRGGIPALAAALTTCGGWWAFAHAIGPATFRTLFGPRDVAYTTPHLLNRIRFEPLAVPIGRASILAAVSEPSTKELPEVENWQITIGMNTLVVQRHPSGALKPDQVHKRNLGAWLRNTSGDDIVVDADGNKTPFSTFQTLLPPRDISKHLVNYLSKVYNSRAIPGRVSLPYGALKAFPGSFQEFLESLARGPLWEDGIQIERLVCPFDLETTTIGIMILPITTQVLVYNWSCEKSLGEEALKVCDFLT